MCSCVNRVVLIIVNVLFVLIGAAVVGVSLWVLLSQDSLFNVVKLATSSATVDDAALQNYMNSPSMLRAAAWVLVGFGGFSLLVGLCGCIGAWAESSCLLILYAVLVCVVLIAEIAGAVLAAVFKAQISSDLKPRLTSLEQKHYLPLEQAINNTNASASITATVNYFQVTFGCCGIQSSSDLTANTSLWSKSNPKFNNRSLTVPVTCCAMKQNKGDLLSRNDWTNVLNYLQDPNCPFAGAAGNPITMGCYDQIDSYITRYTWPLIIGGIVIGLSELLCVVMACAMVQKIRSGEAGMSV